MNEFTKYCLKRELRSFRQGWGLLVLVVGGLHFIGYMIVRLGFGFVEKDIASALYFYFTGFHLWLFVAVPLIAWWQARQFRVYRLDELRMSLIPERAMLTMVWARAAIKPLALLLMLYFGLWWVFPWLYDHDPQNDMFSDIDWDFLKDPVFGIFVLNQLGLILLFLYPMVRHRRKRAIFLWILIAVFLITFIIISYHNGLEFPSLFGFFHPTVTLPYFILTAMVHSLFAVRIGLCPPRRLREIAPVVCILVPLVFEVIVNATYLYLIEGDLDDLLDSWMFLWVMLLFYMSTAGAVWMGLKWNLIWWMLRRPLRW